MTPDFTFPPAQAALLVVDMQRYCTEPDHAFARVAAARVEGGVQHYFDRVEQLVIPSIRSLLEIFRQQDRPVIYTAFGSYLSDGRDLPLWARRLDDHGRSAFGAPVFPAFAQAIADIDLRIAPRPGEPVLRKTTAGAVASSSLDPNLRAMGITHIVVSGVVTPLCVMQTARELADRNFEVAVVDDACASFTEVAHAAALTTFAGAFGWVRSAAQIIRALTGGCRR